MNQRIQRISSQVISWISISLLIRLQHSIDHETRSYLQRHTFYIFLAVAISRVTAVNAEMR